MSSLTNTRLINGMTNLVEAVRGSTKGELIIKTAKVLTCIGQFIMDNENFTDAERELIFAQAERVMQPNDKLPPTER